MGRKESNQTNNYQFLSVHLTVFDDIKNEKPNNMYQTGEAAIVIAFNSRRTRIKGH